MQDFSSVNIKNMIIHNVGNKVKGESLDLSTEICDTNNKVTNQYLKQFFFSTFKFDITYRFVHETDIAMNEIYNYVKHIFDNSDQFYEQSVNIAKHLYEVSVHPNIKAGELCIVYLQNCIIDDNVTDAVGIYKSESKDYYLQVNSTENGYDIECQQGINPKKLDKGCLIFNSSDSNYKVCVVDKNVNDAMYWKKLFLMIKEEKNEYVNTSKTLKSCKRYIAKNEDLEPKKKLELINNSVEYFENNDEFDLEKFSEKVFNNKKYVRKIESMGEGLVLFEISVVDKRVGQNYHLFFEDKRKPPLDIAINPDDGMIEYISYFAQDEMINNISDIPEIINEDMGISICNKDFNEDNMNVTVDGRFKFWKLENTILILKNDIEELVLNAYRINDLNNLLFLGDDFVGIEFKNLNQEEILEIHNSKCLL